MKKSISIFGCGFLGYSLAKSFKENCHVKVTTRRNEEMKKLQDEGFEAFLFDEENFSNIDDLLDTNIIFINFPPSKSKNYLSFLSKIYKHKNFHNVSKVVFVSSTSIYPNENDLFNESYFIKNSISQTVYDAESQVKDKTHIILRVAGLMGGHRIAGKYFSNKLVDNKNAKINHVHKDDVIEATKFLIEHNHNGVFNLCSKFHPTKEELYSENAKKYNFDMPIFKESKAYKDRVIDGSKIEKLGYIYKYNNPLKF